MTRAFVVPALAAACLAAPAAAGAAEVVTVPVDGAHPNTQPSARPHQTFNGHATTLKAIARGFANSAQAGSAVFRWDTDADGDFSDEVAEAVRGCVNGTTEGTNCYDLAKKLVIPNQSTSRRLDFAIQLSVPGEPAKVATYPVWVRADAPAQADPNSNATALPQDASASQLRSMRAVAVDDALWRLHLLMTRSGTGSALSGLLPTSSFAEPTPAFVRLAARTGHTPAYPPGTYNHGINASAAWTRPVSPPAGFTAGNDARYLGDPYAETAMRALNWSISNLSAVAIGNALDEGDDGTTPVPDTNDGTGLLFENSVLKHGDFVRAVVESGLEGTVAQVGNATHVQGHTFNQLGQQLVDWLVWGQEDCANSGIHGGWYYTPNACISHLNHENSSRSVYGALAAAQASSPQTGVYVNRRVRDRMASILRYNQDSGTKLSRPFSTTCTGSGLFTETADALQAMGLLGWSTFGAADATVQVVADATGAPITRGQGRQLFDSYLNALGANWVSFQFSCHPWVNGLFFNDGGANPSPWLRTDGKAHIEGLYAVTAGIKSLPNADTFAVLASHDFEREFGVYLVRNQTSDGQWMEARWNASGIAQPGMDFHGPTLLTVWASETLAFGLPPYTEPDTVIHSGPAGTTLDPTPTFEFSGGAFSQCSIDGQPPQRCDTPGSPGRRSFTAAELAHGAHTLTVTALAEDGAGDRTPATRSFTVDRSPQNVVAPALTPSAAEVGEELGCSQGSWDGAPTSFEYEWRRDGTPIAGATAAEYTLETDDGGGTITCAVEATNSHAASAPAESAPLDARAATVNVAAPSVSPGTVVPGDALTCSPGSWANSPSAFTYAWQRGGTTLPGETAATFGVTAVDVGQQIRCLVAARKTGGGFTAQAESNAVTPSAAPTTGGDSPGDGSPGGGSPGGGEAPDTRPPAVGLAVAARTRLRAALKTGLPVKVSSDEACALSLTLLLDARTARKLGLTRGRRPVIVGRAARSLGAGTNSLRVKLAKKARGKLRRLRSVKLTSVATCADAAGNLGTARHVVKLKR